MGSPAIDQGGMVLANHCISDERVNHWNRETPQPRHRWNTFLLHTTLFDAYLLL